MIVQTVSWLVFLALIKNFSCDSSIPFDIESLQLTATEGSCIEIKCTVTGSVNDNGAYWFWMKDAEWIQSHGNFTATIIYSTDNLKRPVSPDFAGRVQYVGSPSSSWIRGSTSSVKPLCSVLICNLRKSDSGQYSLRFIGPDPLKWVTQKNVTLTVAENPCLITFEKTPPVMKENDTISLTCSTSSSCSSNLQVTDVSQLPSTPLSNSQQNNTHKSITVSFIVNWQHDGRMFSCQTQDNTDKYLTRNVSIIVEYGPKDISATESPENVKEGDSVTLTCSAKGNPNPTFTWLKNNSSVSSNNMLTFTSINVADNGKYYCNATNKLGIVQSDTITIDVTYAPDVEIKMTLPVVREGDTMTLDCNVKRSKPEPNSYTWFKAHRQIDQGKTYVKQMLKPEDRGFYTCSATNTVGTGTSEQREIKVEYRPRTTSISIITNEVKVGSTITFTCHTEAYPPPSRYSWYRYNSNKQFDSSQWTYRTTDGENLRLERVQRADEACYMCNATNSIGTGDNSRPVCIEVLYPPTVPVLSMIANITENQTITVTCTVESFPTSTLTLGRNPRSKASISESHFTHLSDIRQNKLHHRFNVTSNDAGFYTCSAQNSEGSTKSKERELVVKYSPKDVTIQPQPQTQPYVAVNENKSLTLNCTARSFPQADNFIWTKDGKEELSPSWRTQNITIKFVSPSHSGLYKCEAKNTIGTGQSEGVEVKVKYAPKHTKITQSTKHPDASGIDYINLNCSAQCFPAVTNYLWYKKGKDTKTDKMMHEGQTYRVSSNEPGIYYCIARNEIGEKQSNAVNLFDGSLMMLLKILLCVLLLPLIILTIFLVYRYRRKNSIQQGATQPCFSVPGWSNGTRRGHLIHETVLAEPSRSRDDLLPERSYRPEAQRCQPPPDSTSASNISSIYSMVNVPPRKQAPAAQKPTRPQGGHTVDDSLNYASLHFGNKQNNKQAKPAEDAVYAKVSKNNQKWLADYENIRATHAANSANPLDDDTDTSDDDDVQLNYSQVTFTAKPGHQGADSDSSSTSSDDDQIQYSDIKI